MGPAPELAPLPDSLASVTTTPVAINPESTMYTVFPTVVIPSDKELLKQALEEKRNAGVWNACPDEVISQEAVVQLRIIHTAERDRVSKRTSDDPVEHGKQMEDFSRTATARTLGVLYETQTTSPTVKAVRESMSRLTAPDEHQKNTWHMNPQPSVNNDNTWQQAVSWLLNVTIGPLGLSIRTQHIFLVLYIMRFEHMWLQDWGSGKVGISSILCGRAAVGKSFVLNYMTLLSLAGSVDIVSRMTGQAIVTGMSRAFAMYVWHEGQPAALVDANDATAGKKAEKAGGNTEHAQQMKSMMSEGCVTTYAMHKDDETGNRMTKKFTSLVIACWMIAINWDKTLLAGPLVVGACANVHLILTPFPT
jgi:hypothetical protein